MVRRVCSAIMMVVLLAAVGLLPVPVRGAEFDLDKFNYEIGLRFGYGKNYRNASVHLYSFLPRWGFFFVKPGQQLGPVGLSFIVEGIASVAVAEDTGFELGLTPLLKASLLLFPNTLAFIEGGAGLISESFNSPALAPHAFNFTPQIGGGFDFALTPQLALSLAYRFRHSSNAGIYAQNQSFNVNFFQAGLVYYY